MHALLGISQSDKKSHHDMFAEVSLHECTGTMIFGSSKTRSPERCHTHPKFPSIHIQHASCARELAANVHSDCRLLVSGTQMKRRRNAQLHQWENMLELRPQITSTQHRKKEAHDAATSTNACVSTLLKSPGKYSRHNTRMGGPGNNGPTSVNIQ